MTDFLDARLKAPRICSPASRLLFLLPFLRQIRSAFPSSAPTFDSLVFPLFSFSYAFPEWFSPFHPSPSVFLAPFLLPQDSYSSCFLSFFCFSKTTTLFFFLPNPISRFPTPLAQNLLPDFPVLLRNRLFRFFYPPISLFPYFFSEGCPLSSVFFTNYPLNDGKNTRRKFPVCFFYKPMNFVYEQYKFPQFFANCQR